MATIQHSLRMALVDLRHQEHHLEKALNLAYTDTLSYPSSGRIQQALATNHIAQTDLNNILTDIARRSRRAKH